MNKFARIGLGLTLGAILYLSSPRVMTTVEWGFYIAGAFGVSFFLWVGKDE